MRPALFCVLATAIFTASALGDDHPVMQWVKRHPLPDAKQPSPRLGYEGSLGYDPQTKLLIHYGGHNQGGGGEQNSEVWTYDLARDVWKHCEPNDAPPGVCCAQQNVFHPRLRKFVRFPAFSGSHGWQSPREIALKDSSVWTYDLDTNRWQAMRPASDIRPSPLRGAAYHPGSDLIVLHGGEGSSHGTVAYDLATNTWHRLNSKGGPDAGLSQPGFAYDAVNDVFVCFGSQFRSDPKTYLFDLNKNEWRVLETKEHPPADKTSPVLAADTRNGIVLCLVRSGEEDSTLQTWVLDVKAATWTKLADVKPPDPSGSRSRVLLYLEDQNLFVLENNTKVANTREQQMWTFRYKEAKGPVAGVQRKDENPPVPLGPVVSVEGPKQVKLTWPKSQDPNVVGYVVERAPVSVYSNQQAARVARRYPDASDAAVGTVKMVGSFVPQTEHPISETSFVDTTVDLAAGQQAVPEPHVMTRILRGEQLNQQGKPYRFATYAYRIRAVNKLEVASGPSPMAFTWPAAVENLKSKEKGKTATRLKWDASPAKGIKGYLVYRHDGRYDKDAITRLTPEPIKETEFLDEHAGTATRRYEIVVVDALGQEGEPTQPVWSRREWKSFYDPYVGEWHQ